MDPILRHWLPFLGSEIRSQPWQLVVFLCLISFRTSINGSLGLTCPWAFLDYHYMRHEGVHPCPRALGIQPCLSGACHQDGECGSCLVAHWIQNGDVLFDLGLFEILGCLSSCSLLGACLIFRRNIPFVPYD